jgi:hypothetical protein
MPVSVRLEPALEFKLEQASRKLKINKSEVIKRSLESYLAQIDASRNSYHLGKELFGADTTTDTNVSRRYKSLLRKELRAKHSR